MGILWHELQKICCLFKNVHNFLKNCLQALLACFQLFPRLVAGISLPRTQSTYQGVCMGQGYKSSVSGYS